MRRAKRVIRVLIADQHLLFRRGLHALFAAENDLQVAGEASSAAEALLQVRAMQPEVLVMDFGLVESEGQQTAFAIRQAHPSVAILFLVQDDGPAQLEMAIAAGARGYMLKSSTPAQILAAVRQVAISPENQNPRSLSHIVPDLRALAKSNENYARGAVLTAREQEVMKLLAEGRTVREVASELSLSVKTVEAHKLNLMRKLDIHNRASLIEYAHQKGLIGASMSQ